MSPVTPNPAAEFSTFAMTKSIWSLLDEGGEHAPHDFAARLREDVADEQDFHAVGPSRLTGGADTSLRHAHRPAAVASGTPDVDPDVTAAPLLDARQDHPQLTLDERRRRAAGIDSAGQPDRPRETAEPALREMERRLTMGARLPVASDRQ